VMPRLRSTIPGFSDLIAALAKKLPADQFPKTAAWLAQVQEGGDVDFFQYI